MFIIIRFLFANNVCFLFRNRWFKQPKKWLVPATLEFNLKKSLYIWYPFRNFRTYQTVSLAKNSQIFVFLVSIAWSHNINRFMSVPVNLADNLNKTFQSVTFNRLLVVIELFSRLFSVWAFLIINLFKKFAKLFLH